MSKRKPKFPVGTRVEDRDSGEQGVVVHVFRETRVLRDTVVVRFGRLSDDGIAAPVDSVRRLRKSRR